MKLSIRTVVAALALIPAVVFAQASNQPLTRAQVQNQLTQLRQNGYVPNKLHYPADIQAAEARIHAPAGMNTSENSGIGGTVNGASQSGSLMTMGPNWHAMYGHH